MPPKAVSQGAPQADTRRAFPPASLSQRRVDEIWNFSHEEMNYLEPLDDERRTHFKRFAVGYKISQESLVSAIRPYSTVTDSENLRYIQIGLDNPDPRHIYDLSPEEVDFTLDLPYTLKEVYRIIRVALKSGNFELTPAAIINQYKDLVAGSDRKHNLITLGYERDSEDPRRAEALPSYSAEDVIAIWDLNAAELAYLAVLREDNFSEEFQQNFKELAISCKMDNRNEYTDLLMNDLINCGLVDTLNWHIARGRQNPDPRLVFDLSAAELIYVARLSQDLREEYKFFRIALKWNSTGYNEDNIIASFKEHLDNGRPSEYLALIEKGQEHFANDMRAPDARPIKEVPSSPNMHKYVEDDKYPLPTRRDITHINDTLGSINRPGVWRFVKTVWQNQHFIDYHRIIHVFVRINEHENILERIVIKVQGEATPEHAEGRTDFEYRHQHSVSKKNCDYILDAYGKSTRLRPSPPHLSYVYMDYAGFGDLNQLMERHRIANVQVPEPFVWIVFRGLAEALHVLLTGRGIASDLPSGVDIYKANAEIDADDGWIPIVNCDIKPMNVVLADPLAAFPAFNTPKMIDFGIARDSGSLIDRAKRHFGVATVGFRAPEVYELDHPNYTKYYKNDVSNHIDLTLDIFGVGMVILNLMDSEQVYAHWPKGAITRRPRHSNGYSYTYSKRLEDLMLKCLELDKSRRPTLYSLLYETKVGLREWEDAYESIRGKKFNDLERSTRRTRFIGYDTFTLGNRVSNNLKRRWAEEDGPPPISPRPRQRQRPDIEPGDSTLS